jgi:hypothetical protein
MKMKVNQVKMIFFKERKKKEKMKVNQVKMVFFKVEKDR